MKNLLFVAGLLSAISLSACAYQSNLDKKLQGKDSLEKQAILASECRKESGPPTVNSEQAQKRMKELCDAMIKEMKQ